MPAEVKSNATTFCNRQPARTKMGWRAGLSIVESGFHAPVAVPVEPVLSDARRLAEGYRPKAIVGISIFHHHRLVGCPADCLRTSHLLSVSHRQTQDGLPGGQTEERVQPEKNGPGTPNRPAQQSGPTGSPNPHHGRQTRRFATGVEDKSHSTLGQQADAATVDLGIFHAPFLDCHPRGDIPRQQQSAVHVHIVQHRAQLGNRRDAHG